MTAPADVGAAQERFLEAGRGRTVTLYELVAIEQDLLWALHIAMEPPADDDTDQEREQREAAIAAIEQMVDVNDLAFLTKVDGYVCIMRDLAMLKDRRKTEVARMARQAKAAERAEEWLKARLLTAMQILERDRVETGRFTVRLQANPPHVEVLDAALVPGEFTRTKIEVSVDKVGILAAFKQDGLVVPGTTIERGVSLRVS